MAPNHNREDRTYKTITIATGILLAIAVHTGSLVWVLSSLQTKSDAYAVQLQKAADRESVTRELDALSARITKLEK